MDLERVDNPAFVSSGQSPADGLRQESLINPAQGTYFPWSDGPQNCPGVRFAQVTLPLVRFALREPVSTPSESSVH
ncbi:MAG: hypothetical protein Q9181_005084 [Wetmoreana brouardii]